VRLAGDRGLEVLLRVADREARRRVADLLDVVEMAVRVARLTVGRLLEVAGDLRFACDSPAKASFRFWSVLVPASDLPISILLVRFQ
jgi:hypothetical protein